MKLQGKNGLVTGGSRGIGRGCVAEMAKAGANVAINYHSRADEAELAAADVQAAGRKALTLKGDVSSRERVEEMVAETVAAFGSLDLFVSNAVYSDRQLMLEADLAGFERTINVSMWGAFYGLRAAARQMVQQGTGGAIVIVSSPHSYIPFPTAMAYNMAKAAIDQMARTAALELARYRIRVNIMHPGWTDTPGERKFFSEDSLQAGAQSIPWKRMGTSEEVGRMVATMLSDDCDYMTGATITLDGGITLPWWSNREGGGQ